MALAMTAPKANGREPLSIRARCTGCLSGDAVPSCPMSCLGLNCQMSCPMWCHSNCCCCCLLCPFPTWCRSSGRPCSAGEPSVVWLESVVPDGVLLLGVEESVPCDWFWAFEDELAEVELSCVLSVCALLILRLGVAICIALGRARRQDWLGTLAQTLTGGGDKDGAGAGDDRDDGDSDREDDDLLLRLAALCRGLGAQAVRGRRGPWSRAPQPGASPA